MAENIVKNRNYQPGNKFEFAVDRLPDFNYFVQSVVLPGLSIQVASNASGTPFSRIPWQGDHIDFSELTVDFKVDEDMRNWYEIWHWMQGIGFPKNFTQYGDMKKGQDKNLDGEKRELPQPPRIGHIYGQASLTINSSHNNPVITVNFIDIHPISLSDLKFETTNNDVEYILGTVTFRYNYYEIVKP